MGIEKTVNEKSRTLYHFVKTAVMEAPDVPGHIIGIVDASGLYFPDTGELASWSSKISVDLINGTGTHQIYWVQTFEDKSSMVAHGKGVTSARPEGTSTFEGTYTYRRHGPLCRCQGRRFVYRQAPSASESGSSRRRFF